MSEPLTLGPFDLDLHPLNPPHHLPNVPKRLQGTVKGDIPRPSLKRTVSIFSRLLITVEESVDLRKPAVVVSC